MKTTDKRKAFVNEDGKELDGFLSVFPICKQQRDKEGKYSILGTGFFITMYGLFVTAKHVLADVLDEKGNQTENVGMIQFIGDKKCIFRPIAKGVLHSTSDIAVGVLADARNKDTGEQVKNPVLKLTLSSPQRGQEVSTFGFPNTEFIKNEEVRQILIKESWHHGLYEQFVPDASEEGSKKIKGPCYRVKMELPGAASGAPVAGPDGNIFGVASTNWGNDLTYVARINEILNLKIQEFQLDCFDKDEFLIRDIVDLKHIVVE